MMSGRYRWWPTDSKDTEPEEVDVEPWPGEQPAFGRDWLVLKAERNGHTAIQERFFLRRRHQRIEKETRR